MESTFISPYRDDIIISWPELHRDTRLLCHALMDKGPFKGIIAIARGGMIPAGTGLAYHRMRKGNIAGVDLASANVLVSDELPVGEGEL